MPDVAPGITPGHPAGPRLPPLTQCPLLPVLGVPLTARGQGRGPGPLSRSENKHECDHCDIHIYQLLHVYSVFRLAPATGDIPL